VESMNDIFKIFGRDKRKTKFNISPKTGMVKVVSRRFRTMYDVPCIMYLEMETKSKRQEPRQNHPVDNTRFLGLASSAVGATDLLAPGFMDSRFQYLLFCRDLHKRKFNLSP
jgi:hypothetical protein